MSNIALIGYRGTGKSTVARHLGRVTGRTVVDTDQMIVARAGMPIREIFATAGEQAFRELEQAVIAEVCARADQVISCGGGVVVREANIAALRAGAFVVWLRASPAIIRRRLAADPGSSTARPGLTPAGLLGEIERVLSERESLYARASHVFIDTQSLTPEAVAHRIASYLPRQPPPGERG